ncbi:S9 family peptidase [Lacihabitans sp. LS3-19]|uniref:S9 family peptidase n=1 Tax=Lacihabitans sp. LS3-19 TaxID=2487335 RepID=UPI0020CF3679|nr:prolyl oligopeptidase family serine peptidase [Lacihabitans sp. LS3-19]MCP9770093.1 S9 family peptidase [Lacihabitans sp. LS3-19]
MKIKILLFLNLCFFTAFSQSKLTVEKIMQDPKWIGTSPSEISWSDDSKSIYFKWNPEKNLGDSLYNYSLKSKKTEKVSKKDRLTLTAEGKYNLDYTNKVYAKDGDLYLYYPQTNTTLRITKTVDIESRPSFSVDGQSILFVKNQNVYAQNIVNGSVEQLTDFKSGSKSSEKKKTEEEAWLEKDQMALFEVLTERKTKEKESKKNNPEPKGPKKIYLEDNRLSNVNISPNSDFIAYSLIETPKNQKSTIVPNYVTNSGYTTDIPARNKVGSPQNSSSAYIYCIAADTVFKLSSKGLPGLNTFPEFFKDYPKIDSATKAKGREVQFYNFVWSPLGTKLIAEARTIDHKDRWIVEVDLASGKTKSIDHQRDEAWIGGPGISNFASTLGFLDENTIYFQSEETGYSHLYKMDLVSNKKQALTNGKFEVLKVELSVDKSKFYVTTNEVHPGEQHFYHLSVNGGEMKKITNMTGSNDVTISPDEKYLAIRYSYSNKPWELYLQKNDAGAKAEKLTNSLTKEFEAYAWRDPKVITFKAEDGQEIYGRLYEPDAKIAKAKGKPAVIFVHGAGYLQNAHKWWSNYFREYMFHNLLTDLGYTVFDIDYRASAGYGRDVRTGIYRYMGGKDLSDQVDATKFLIKNYGVDAKKIGIYGGSYGGFITLMALFTTPDVFKAGAALRPVTDWAAYNHGYTSNILNTPQTDSIAYHRSSPIYFADGLKNNLLICHGVVDVNVHYQDVVRLSQRLIELKKDNWSMASYPMEDHGFVEPSSWTDEYKRILKLFEEKLK